jgi:hypothetical protein
MPMKVVAALPPKFSPQIISSTPMLCECRKLLGKLNSGTI